MSRLAWPENRLSQLVGLRDPGVQGPFGGFRSQLALVTAAVSRFGGLGSLGANSLQPQEIVAVVSPAADSDECALRGEWVRSTGAGRDRREAPGVEFHLLHSARRSSAALLAPRNPNHRNRNDTGRSDPRSSVRASMRLWRRDSTGP